MATGLYTIDDLIQTRFVTAKAFGLQTIADVLRLDLAAHNAIVDQMVSELCEVTGDARRIYGGSNDANMTEVDPLGRAPGQKNVSGAEVAFPLKAFQYNTGWTERWLENATVADVAQRQLDAEKAHLKQIARQIKLAIFDDTNYSFVDLNVDNVSINVKRFCNADSAVIPDGPDGTTFAGASHTHYTAATPMVVANLTDLINLVVEHGHANDVILAINVAQEAAVRGFSGFTALVDARLTINQAANQPVQRYDYSRTPTNNRPIGLLGGAMVWVKPWVPASYQFAYDAGDSRKPLCYRQRVSGGVRQGLRMAGNFSSHPFGGESMEAEFGVGVWTRTNGAANYIGVAWTDATL